MEIKNSFAEIYYSYLCNSYPETELATIEKLDNVFDSTNWDNPQTSTDWNNLAVINLVEAETEEDLDRKQELVSSARAMLDKGFSIDQNLLCIAHYALIESLTGEDKTVFSLILHSSIYAVPPVSVCLIYLPKQQRDNLEFNSILTMDDPETQSIMFFAEVIRRSQYIFYNNNGLRFLRLAHQLNPNNLQILLQLGIVQIMGRQSEGIVWLKDSLRLDQSNSVTWQSLFLAYKDIGDLHKAEEHLQLASKHFISQQISWQWVTLPVNSNYTYLQFDEDIQLTVEPSFSSIVTTMLIGSGDWFERELEFWRTQIISGMTIIDVGANAGIYTFSAAKRVGAEGIVLAIEPFSKCVSYLKETCRANNMNWVKVCAGAASDRIGTAKLAIHSASELNEIISDDTISNPNNFEEVDCITLDSLIDEYALTKVNFLKIDAEGHELQVLKGSQRILSEFRPTILYENIAGTQGSNLPVAEYLQALGYQLFKYQPYLKTLTPIQTNEIMDTLNIIAIAQARVT